jgi:kinesin family protein 20
MLNLAQVMIVNVNPYDTGFDENSHVMRFSAVAREVQTTAANKVTFPGLGLKRQISSQFSALKQAVSGPMKIKVVVPVLPKVVEGEASAAGATTGRPAGAVRLVVGGRETDGFVMVEEELEVVEEDEGESEDERDVLVDSLFEQLKELKTRVGRRGVSLRCR